MMKKQDYQLLAAVLRAERTAINSDLSTLTLERTAALAPVSRIENVLVAELKADNPRFAEPLFRKACQ